MTVAHLVWLLARFVVALAAVYGTAAGVVVLTARAAFEIRARRTDARLRDDGWIRS